MLINQEQQLANCIRFLAVDAINAANSGHPGMPLGLADVMTVLFREYLRHNPQNPRWANRDRVVLSNGHGSMLLYAALYLSGYDWDLEELKAFRQQGSAAAGHPEYDLDKGVEVTTGPLGQGLANAVGMAVARERLQALYGKENIDYKTYCFVGDGCLMEGISHEAGALAPKLVREGLIVIWDDNGISIDGQIDPWFESDVLARFASYGFEIIADVDGHDMDAIRKAFDQAQEAKSPCFIQMKTIIGRGCPSIEATAKAHGQPLSVEAMAEMRQALDWPYSPFEVPDGLLRLWRHKGEAADAWEIPAEADITQDMLAWLAQQPSQAMATRGASSLVLQALAPKLPHLVGGSADLTASNLTQLPTPGLMNQHDFSKAYIAYGVREHAMFAMANGLALSGLLPFVGTFLTFMDYGRNSLRMSALMKLRVIYVLTHDSIGLGEDGPTHQPIEHLTMCRATPGVRLWRPCNLAETTVAWLDALAYDGPTVLALSRQKIAAIKACDTIDQVFQGAYQLISAQKPQLVILATGSEVSIAIDVANLLAQKQIFADVVSVPCLDKLNTAKSVEDIIRLPRTHCFVIEAGSGLSWHRWAPSENLFCIDEFGHSAKAQDLYRHFGLDAQKISAKIQQQLLEEKG